MKTITKVYITAIKICGTCKKQIVCTNISGISKIHFFYFLLIYIRENNAFPQKINKHCGFTQDLGAKCK